MEKTSLIYLKDSFEEYLDFDFLDELSPPKKKRDGRLYGTYLAELRPEYAGLTQEHRTVVLKQISEKQSDIYKSLCSSWCPYLETVFGVVPTGYSPVAVNEFIEKPSSLIYSTDELKEKRTLSLEEYIQNFGCFSETEALVFFIQLCEGLEQLRKLHVVHGDVAPQNILLTDRFPGYPEPFPKIPGLHQKVSLKLIDFDIAREEKEPEHLVTTVEGTNPYAAPEILDYKTPTDRVDIYSLGCVLSFMLTGKSPKQQKKSELDRLYSSFIKKLIKKCTADYYMRYKNIRELKHEVLYHVSGSPFPASNILHSIPGFRSGYRIRMCTASMLYGIFLFMIGLTITQADISSLRNFLCFFAYILLSLILTLDVFHLGRLSKKYLHYRIKYPWLRYLVKLTVGLIFPFIILCLIVK